MTTDIATAKRETDLAVYESLALRGDISGLKPAERVRYFTELCNSLGLNPATQPLIPLTLNGKQTFYFAKGATDQLARIHNLRREVLSREPFQDVFVVTVRATLPEGRAEDSIGAVAIGGLKGEALSNALMKAETKAKRRATLSILGLGGLDESELESIPAESFTTAEPARIEPVRTEPRQIRAAVAGINGEQRGRLAKLSRDLIAAGVAKENLQGKMKDMAGVSSSADLTSIQAEQVIGVFAQWNASLVEAADEKAERDAIQAESEPVVETPKKVEVPF
jgi:hypothetical protein